MKKNISITLIFILASTFLHAQNTTQYYLWARANTSLATITLWDGTVTEIYGFAENVGVPPLPAPTLYVNEGDTLAVWMKNLSRGAPHTIHWHGLDVDQANDGVAQTSFYLAHDEDHTYKFVAQRAGTYLYHCHVASVFHVQLGMYGNVIVRPADGSQRAWTNGPAFDKERIWLMSELDKNWHDSVPEHFTGDSVNPFFQVPEYIPGYFLVSGKSRQQLNDTTLSVVGKVGQKIYMRLSNVGFLYNEVIFPPELNAEIISSDGRPLPVPLSRDSVILMPGERYGVMLSPSVEMSTTATVNFYEMNTDSLWGTESPPVEINGFVGMGDKNENHSLKLYPNPTDDYLFLLYKTTKPAAATLKIFTVLGAEVYSEALSAGPVVYQTIPTKSFRSGIYFVEIQSGDKKLRQKFVVRH